MVIVSGSDHRGVELRIDITDWLRAKAGASIIDCGPFKSSDTTDYPVIARAVCEQLLDLNQEALGLLVCGSGIGVCMAANRFHDIRAVTCRDTEDARMAKLHNNANVLCLGADRTNFDIAKEIAVFFIQTPFTGEPRHERRIQMMDEGDFTQLA